MRTVICLDVDNLSRNTGERVNHHCPLSPHNPFSKGFQYVAIDVDYQDLRWKLIEFGSTKVNREDWRG